MCVINVCANSDDDDDLCEWIYLGKRHTWLKKINEKRKSVVFLNLNW
jgi:hypothetical protein